MNTKNDVRPSSADKNGKVLAVAVVNESRRHFFVFASPRPLLELFEFFRLFGSPRTVWPFRTKGDRIDIDSRRSALFVGESH